MKLIRNIFAWSAFTIMGGQISASGADTALYWNASGTGTSANGGTGTWNATSIRWLLLTGSGGFVPVPWIDDSVTIFSGGAGTVTLATNVSARTLAFVVPGYNLISNGSSQITMIGNSTTSASVQGTTGTTTIGAAMTGSATLSFSRSASTSPIFVLTGENSWTGGTSVGTGAILQIGSGSTTGSLPSTGGVYVQGTLTFNRSDTTLNSNDIFGSGKMIKKGGGTVVLTDEVSVSQGIDLQQGAIQIGSGSSTGRLACGLVNSGTLIFNRSNLVTLYSFSTLITGKGGVIKRGSGILELSGNFPYTGNTSVETGILKLGTGGSSFGTVGGTITVSEGASLESNASGTLTMANSISGLGEFKVTGGQSLTYQGLCQISGTTTVASGSVLLMGNSTGFGPVTGPIVTNGLLKISPSASATFSAAYTGTGSVEHTGTGTSVFVGTKSYQGTTTVNSGKLTVNTNLNGGGAVNIGTGGRFGGTGTITGAVALNGIHEPGDVFGAQVFLSTVTYGPTSKVKWELASNTDTPDTTKFDTIEAASVVVGNGATLDVVLNTSGSEVSISDMFWDSPRSWRILKTTGGLTGEFRLGTVSNDSKSLDTAPQGLFTLTNDTGGVTLKWIPMTPFLSWRIANFSVKWNDPAYGGPLADPDHDGLVNALEYLFGSAASSASSSGMIASTNDEGVFQMTYTRRKAAVAELGVTAEYSSSPQGPWETGGVTEEILSDDGTTQLVVVSKSIGGKSTGYFHLRVTTTQ